MGWNYGGAVDTCYAIGEVTGGNSSSQLGGLLGYYSFGDVNDCFWDMETSGMSTSDGGTGKSTAEMKTVSTFLDASWDFIETWDIGENQTYPYLRAYPAGDLNHDRQVNWPDFSIFVDHWLAGVE